MGSLVDWSRTHCPVQVSCPHCGAEETLPDTPPFDAMCRCVACSEESDYRLMREAWLDHRRAEWIAFKAAPALPGIGDRRNPPAWGRDRH